LNIDDIGGCPVEGLNCCTATPEGCLDDVEAIAQIEDLASIGVQTIVVGIPGSEPYASVLEDFATVGELVPPGASGAEPFRVSAQGGEAELTATLAGIYDEITTELVRSCELPITEEQLDNINLDDVHVAVDCQIIPRDQNLEAESGWHFDVPEEPTALVIHGDICTTILVEGVQRIDAVFGCPVFDEGG
jgi:hypothetical protein